MGAVASVLTIESKFVQISYYISYMSVMSGWADTDQNKYQHRRGDKISHYKALYIWVQSEDHIGSLHSLSRCRVSSSRIQRQWRGTLERTEKSNQSWVVSTSRQRQEQPTLSCFSLRLPSILFDFWESVLTRGTFLQNWCCVCSSSSLLYSVLDSVTWRARHLATIIISCQ